MSASHRIRHRLQLPGRNVLRRQRPTEDHERGFHLPTWGYLPPSHRVSSRSSGSSRSDYMPHLLRDDRLLYHSGANHLRAGP